MSILTPTGICVKHNIRMTHDKHSNSHWCPECDRINLEELRNVFKKQRGLFTKTAAKQSKKH